MGKNDWEKISQGLNDSLKKTGKLLNYDNNSESLVCMCQALSSHFYTQNSQ